jgi:hypothetical protein
MSTFVDRSAGIRTRSFSQKMRTQIPASGSGNPSSAAMGYASQLARAALEAFTEAERLYVANGEDPANPSPLHRKATTSSSPQGSGRGG